MPKELEQETELQTCKDKIKKLHILSKLRNMCQNDRISTKLTFPIQLSLPAGLSSWTKTRKISTNYKSSVPTCLIEKIVILGPQTLTTREFATPSE